MTARTCLVAWLRSHPATVSIVGLLIVVGIASMAIGHRGLLAMSLLSPWC